MTTSAPTLTQHLFNKVGFTPTPEQEIILNSNKRFVLIAGGEQGGKSKVAAMYLLARCFDVPPGKPALYWLIAADYNRTRAEFDYLIEAFSALGMLKESTKRVDPGQIELEDGTRIITKSGKDPRTLAMHAPDGIIGCEASQLDLETYMRIQARSAPKRAWVMLSGTFESSLGWYPRLYESWQTGMGDSQSFSLPSWTNFHLYPGGRNDPEILRLKDESSDEFFLERIEGIPCPPKGRVFGEFRPDIHIRDIKWDPFIDVGIWIDPGYAGAYAVEVIQEKDGVIQVIDEVYEQDKVTKDVIEICQSRFWWKRFSEGGYGTIDIAGTQHQAMGAASEMWLDETGVALGSRKIDQMEGIERLKTFLRVNPTSLEPKIVFSSHCRGILSEFGIIPNPFDGQTKAYRWKVDRDGNAVGETPENRYNHGIKAVIYGLVDRYGFARAKFRQHARVKRWK